MTANPPRRRGDKHPIYRIFIGWGELDDTYHLTGSRHYRFTGQRCGAKVIYSIEQVLLNVIDSNNTSKFNSNLEKSESTLPNEINKATFIKMLQKKVWLHGEQSLYTVKYQSKVLSLFDHNHKFTVEEVIAYHEHCCSKPDPVIDPTFNTET